MQSLVEYLKSLQLINLIKKAKEKGDWGPVLNYLIKWNSTKSTPGKGMMAAKDVYRPAWEVQIHTELLNQLQHASPEQRERIIEIALMRAEQQQQHAEEAHRQQQSHRKQSNIREWFGTAAGLAVAVVAMVAALAKKAK